MYAKRYCPICRSTSTDSELLVCGFCFGSPDETPRRRRKREHRGLTELFALLEGVVRRPDPRRALEMVLHKLAEK